jgi:hypothetical protein
MLADSHKYYEIVVVVVVVAVVVIVAAVVVVVEFFLKLSTTFQHSIWLSDLQQEDTNNIPTPTNGLSVEWQISLAYQKDQNKNSLVLTTNYYLAVISSRNAGSYSDGAHIQSVGRGLQDKHSALELTASWDIIW